MSAFAGFELGEGETIADLEQWPSFAEWYFDQNDWPASPEYLDCRQLFEAYVQGAFWEWQRRLEGVK